MASLFVSSTLLFLCLLLCPFLTAYASNSVSYPPAEAPAPYQHHHHHHHPPPPPPAATPPVKPPSYPPPMRKKVAVQGVVYCKSCKYRGVNTLVGASPLEGAVVKLECNNTKRGLKEQQKSDKNGYFFFMPPTLSTSGIHKCKVSLVSSPNATCTVPTNLHSGAAGAILFRSRNAAPPKSLPFELFTVGPFAFDAPKELPCHY